MIESETPLTKAETKRQAAEAIDKYVGPYCGDVYLAMLNLFPGFEILTRTFIYPRDDLDFISGGVNENGDAGIWIGQMEGVITPSIKSRITERYGLAVEFIDMPDEALMPFIFAHELGHVLQADTQFEKFFGPINDELIGPEDGYAEYVNSESEANADYIAAVIIGNSSFGIDLNFMPPSEEPVSWRDWAARHPTPNTIAFNSKV